MFGANDLFDAFFNGQGGVGMRSAGSMGGRRQPTEIVAEVPVTLEELYNGAQKQISRARTVCCPDCNGCGTRSRASPSQTRCPLCRGAGARVVVRQMGMMVQQMQVRCDGCGGTGHRIDPKDYCPGCAGRKVTSENCSLVVTVVRGMSDGHRIPLRGGGDFDADTGITRDLVAVLRMAEHATFVRHGDDLHLSRSISLGEALCGFQMKITQLDGRELTVRRNRGEITRPGEMNMIVGEGMPVLREAKRNGDLFVHLQITYPESLSSEQFAAMREAFPEHSSMSPTEESQADEKYECCYVSRVGIASFREEMAREAEDDDEEEGGQHTAGCPMQ